MVTNLLVLPGLGSVLAGRKSGYVQIILAVAGFLVTLVALVKIVLVWVQDFQFPADGHLIGVAFIGLAVFLLAWTWSLVTSLAVFKSREAKPPLI